MKLREVKNTANNVPSYEDVCNHLANYGAPLLRDSSRPVKMSLEETTKWGIQFSQTDGLLESVMSYFLYLNFSKLNRARLFSYLNQENQFQLLGYFLELAFQYSKSKKIKFFLSSFYQPDLPPIYCGMQRPSKRALDVVKSKNNPAARKWNVTVFGSKTDYFDRFRKWEKIV